MSTPSSAHFLTEQAFTGHDLDVGRLSTRKEREFRRRPERHAVRVPCQVVRERDFRLVADRVEDLSPWGMLVGPADPVLTGESVIVSFQIPGTQKWIDACARVARVVHGRRAKDRTRMLGIEFEALSPLDRFRLRRALCRRPLIPPGTRPGRRAWSQAGWGGLEPQFFQR